MLIWLFVLIAIFLVWRVLKFQRPLAMVNARRDAAIARENERIARGEAGPSPLDGVAYTPREQRLFAPAPAGADDVIRGLVRRYIAADEDAREEIRDALRMDDFSTLLAFAGRSAVFGRIDDAVHAVAMVDIERIDELEVPPVLAYIHHAARRARADVRKAFDAAAAMATPAMAAELAKFLEQHPPNADLREYWSFDEVPGGFVHRGDDPYAPKRDLAKLMLGLAEILERDRYAVEWIEIADNWAGARDVEVRGGVSLYANLREPSGEEQEDGQTLMAALLEMPDTRQAERLAETARRDEKGDTARLAVAHRSLLCLLVQEAAAVGEKPIETNESLARFAKPIEALLD